MINLLLNNKIFQEGKNAFINNINWTKNPYQNKKNIISKLFVKQRLKAYAWQKGWEEASANDIVDDEKKIVTLIQKYQYREDLKNIADTICNVGTVHGFPIEISLYFVENKYPNLTNEEKFVILFWLNTKMLEHRLQSRINDKRISEIRKNNRKILKIILKTGQFRDVMPLLV
jgi:hypothetical protein